MSTPLEELKSTILSDNNIRKVAIVMHENPDPDCIASAIGLSKLLKAWRPEVKCTYLYSGEISHSQNKTLVNVLNILMVNLSEIEDLAGSFDVFITVDVMPERALREYLDKEIKILMAIDHHQTETSLAKISDIRQVGATSTIIWDYFQKEGIELKEKDDQDSMIATALLIGIKTDTSDFVGENVKDLDFEAYKSLISKVNRRHHSSIINYPIPPYHFELRSQLDQEDNIRIGDGVFVGGVGYISSLKRDALPMMAEERARVEGIDTAFIFGIVGDHIEVSVRSVGLAVDVNSLCQKIFGKQYAGGKQGAAAAKVPLGFLGVDANMPEEVRDKMWEAVKALMIDKIFHVIGGNV